MQLDYLDGVFEEIDSEESREISGGGIGAAIVGVGIIVVGIIVIGNGLADMANDAYKEHTKDGTLGDLQKK